MKLRWLIRRNTFDKSEVAKFARNSRMTFTEAKKIISDEREPVLQYSENGVDWNDIPTVVLPHDFQVR